MEQEVRTFKALADTTRLRILALLGEGELCVCEIIAALELPQSTISRHLSYLKRSGWVQDRRQGNWMYYRLSADDGSLRSSLQKALQTALDQHPEAIEATARLETFRREHLQKGA